MTYQQFNTLRPAQVQYLTAAQLQSIPDSAAFNRMSTSARGALSAGQIQQLNVRNIGLRGMVRFQINSLTVEQIQSLVPGELRNLSVTQIPSISTRQISNIPNDAMLRTWSAAARAAMTPDQVRALNVGVIGLRSLTAAQVEQLSAAQIQTLAANDGQYLSAAQLGLMADAQIEKVSPAWLVDKFDGGTLTTRFSLINPTAIRGTTRIGTLTVTQIRALSLDGFRTLTAAQIAYLTSQQVASIPNGWSLNQIPATTRVGLLPQQVRALNTANTGIEHVSDMQVGWLSAAQVQQLAYSQFGRLTPATVIHLTAAQLQTIPNDWWFRRMSEATRAALTDAQVQALPLGAIGIDGLTNSQIAVLTRQQAQTLVYSQFGRLTPRLAALLTPAQIATIPNGWWFDRMSAEARAALTSSQVQALVVSAVGLNGLTPAQVEFLTEAQVQSLSYEQFQRLAPSQVPQLTVTQIASIPNGWWLNRMSEAARAQLTGDQVRALNVAAVGLQGLTEAQIAELSSAQVQVLTYDTFNRLTATQTPHLTGEQLASLPNEWWFARMSKEARAALTAEQVRSLVISNVGIERLTASQVDALLPAQIQQVSYDDFDDITVAQVGNLTATQLGTIPNGWWFERIPSDVRAALNDTQVQALPMPQVGLNGLTDEQVHDLSAGQIGVLNHSDFRRLGPAEVVHLTGEQIATIPNTWWFERMSVDARAALSDEQVQHLDVHDVSIRGLTSHQRDVLSHEQVEDLTYPDFQFLTEHQAEHLTREQMNSIPNEWWFRKMSDEARAALSRDQMLSLKNVVLAGLVHQPAAMFAPHEDHGPATAGTTDPTHDHSTHDHGTTTSTSTTTTTTPPNDGLPHPDDPAKRHEHLALFDLVPNAAATFVSIASGNWSSPATWRNGLIPTANAQVLIAAGTTVTFDTVQTTPMEWVRVNGTLDWATQIDTQMFVETLVVDGAGKLQIGTQAVPKSAGTAARIVIADGGAPIDTNWDPDQLSRGVISHGQVEMWGETVTPFAATSQDPRRGDTTLTLDAAPTNWRVGDRLVLTGTQYGWSTPQDEELAIVAINGNTVTIDANDDLPGIQGLQFHHLTPAGHGLHTYVANMNRNIVVMSQNPAINDRRGHVMFMHSPKVSVHNVGFYGLGRSDKRNPSNDPVFDDHGELMANTGLNPRGRYAVHFHRSGVGAASTPALIDGSVVVDSPGWGFVNHQSNVHMRDNVAFNVDGAAFVTEFGDEIGSFVHNLSIRNSGSGDGLEQRQDIFDFGHGGHGFWFQGPGVEVVDNISTGSREAAFIFFTQSSKASFKAENISDPTIAAGRTEVPVGTVPLKRVSGNLAFASAGAGLETWFHLTHMNDGQSYIDHFTAWNVGGSAVFTPYTGRLTLSDITLIGNPSNPRGTAFNRNNVTNNITYERVNVYGFETGISVPVHQATVIRDGHFEAVRAIVINSAEDTLRTVDIVGDPVFVTLTASQLGTRQQFDVYLDGSIDMRNRDIETYFSPDIVRLGTVTFNNHQVYYHKQAANFIAFPSNDSPSWIPPELKDKTNTQLWEEFGIAPAGIIAPEDAVSVNRINGLVGSRAVYQEKLELLSAKYSRNVSSYQLAYSNSRGDRIVDSTPVVLREGWNLLTRQVDGQKRTFFVYGDTVAPTFLLNTQRTDLRVNPLGLDFGIVIHGTVQDDSFGEMSFRREFKNLTTLPVETRADGTQFLVLTFSIRDLAGNETIVRLEIVLDPNAPLVPGTGQRDLPPRDMPRTLTELLEYYFLTGNLPEGAAG